MGGTDSFVAPTTSTAMGLLREPASPFAAADGPGGGAAALVPPLGLPFDETASSRAAAPAPVPTTVASLSSISTLRVAPFAAGLWAPLAGISLRLGGTAAAGGAALPRIAPPPPRSTAAAAPPLVPGRCAGPFGRVSWSSCRSFFQSTFVMPPPMRAAPGVGWRGAGTRPRRPSTTASSTSAKCRDARLLRACMGSSLTYLMMKMFARTPAARAPGPSISRTSSRPRAPVVLSSSLSRSMM